MAKSFNSKLVNLVLNSAAIGVVMSLVACGEGSSSTQGALFSQGATKPATPSNDFNPTLLLQSLTDNVIVPTYTKFAQLAVDQETAIGLYCDAVTSQATDTDTKQMSAKQSWRDAMAVWQIAEVMQIGPLLDNNNALRNKIYSWPNTSACALDQDAVLAEQPGYDINTRTASRKGLDAIEYLLFNPSLDHSCTVFGTDPQGWNNRTDEDRTAARCGLAKMAAADLVSNSEELLAAWTGTETVQGYAEVLKNAGQVDSIFSNAQDAVNDVSDAIFYVDKITKDAKLATPLGVFANDCGLVACVENVESRFAYHSLQNIISNIQGLNMIFLGGETDAGVGFEDYLIDVGAQDTAALMRGDLTEVIAFSLSLQTSLTELLVQDPEQVQEVHDQLKDVTDNMKTDFIQRLALELPATSAGDND